MNNDPEIAAQPGIPTSKRHWIRPKLMELPIAKTASGLLGTGEAVTMDDSVAS